ncbi:MULTISPECIES: sigma-54 dependent transcriptional regulator [unclassified Acinetobacter]|uniref:sigma-54 interaction domain-containing protein n=1 Tax=unclassified Acinetobacter TaxID=196816 RepID=UPI0029350D94|nr:MULTISPECIES: sigma-54 dependent transcriptional regulator [unclassified Acinetobacter]WOE32882.1 sigma-54 dependent transcriptional regulator [Acinetobacter sp. SAAs470]WOE38359.1 sigma-54 dependent transcriptional regulator [Acinetobacter sp. SAAs474]
MIKTPIDFATQSDLDHFLRCLQHLNPDSLIWLKDQDRHEWIYQYTSPRFEPVCLAAISQQLNMSTALQGEIVVPDCAQRWSYSSLTIKIIEQSLTGRIFFVMHPSPLHAQNATAQLDLAQMFHSHSAKMQHMFSIIQRVAKTEFPVLVRGESGSGKELVAQAIHRLSQRHDRVFIAINCAALNTHILESELFGHVKGAFTGAIRDHKGVFERAEGGTLFLDEIAEIPLELQAKLLRVLETAEFTPLGGEKSIKANVRIISATHRALREEVRLGKFRQDLLYRLRVIPIFVPPLRERKEDIPLLTQFILQQQTELNPTISIQALQVLQHYDWPGNVRELKNTLLYALAMSDQRQQIEQYDLPDEIIESPLENMIESEVQQIHPYDQKINAVQLQQLLEKYNYQTAPILRILGISRTTLWRYRKKYNI